MSFDLPDRIDRQLIALLQMNARESTTALAKSLGVARTTVHERINKMERSGVVRGYTVVLSRNPFEQYINVFFLIEIERQKQNSIIESLRKFPEIISCHSTNGECDLVCQVEIPLLEDLEALLNETTDIVGIKRIRSIVSTSMKFDRRSTAVSGQSSAHQMALRRGEAG